MLINTFTGQIYRASKLINSKNGIRHKKTSSVKTDEVKIITPKIPITSLGLDSVYDIQI